MGFFSSSKTKSPRSSDKVWMSREACLKGTLRDSLLALKNGYQPVIMTFFEDSHRQLIDFLDKMKVPYQIPGDYELSALINTGGTVVVMNAYSQPGSAEGLKASLFYLGHYPFLATESALVEKHMTLFQVPEVVFCQSLEDPVFELFGNERLQPMMKTLGLGEDECIEHVMVTKALRRALEKINESIVTETKTSSEKEWFAKNVKKN